MYCVTSLDKPIKVSMKVQAEEFGELTEKEGIIPAPYMARNHWIFVEKSNAFTTKEWKHYTAILRTRFCETTQEN
jgi:predicted DNA-binding protein (MmcQ/YjbR family)